MKLDRRSNGGDPSPTMGTKTKQKIDAEAEMKAHLRSV